MPAGNTRGTIWPDTGIEDMKKNKTRIREPTSIAFVFIVRDDGGGARQHYGAGVMSSPVPCAMTVLPLS